MPGVRTAQYLCDRTRHLVGMVGVGDGTVWDAFDSDKLRDGFDGDEGTSYRVILPGLNEAIGKLIDCGEFKCRFFLAAPAGTLGKVSEFNLPTAMGMIEYVKYRDTSGRWRELEKRRLGTMDRQMPNWQNQPLGTPRSWYNDIPDVIGLWPSPLAGDVIDPVTPTNNTYSIEILAESLTADLVLPGDVPNRIPAQFHDDLPTWAAITILRSLGGTQEIAAKIADLRKDWDGRDNERSTIKRVQDMAQHRSLDEISQLQPYEYRTIYEYRRNGGIY